MTHSTISPIRLSTQVTTVSRRSETRQTLNHPWGGVGLLFSCGYVKIPSEAEPPSIKSAGHARVESVIVERIGCASHVCLIL
ncbi:MAG: hypothetical protein OXN17_14525 [Candidatus Poribacteria bacterium]|nr:hypothetical protein [Candidatus Poribacteria bacterium]MDE0503990.1 hypothetical protein [Candidatus Poribacteria bacterium]